MLICFTSIPEKLKYPPALKGIISSQHSSIIHYTAQRFVSTRKFKRQVIGTMNTITYLHLQGEELPASWSENSPLLADSDIVDEFTLKETLKVIFIDEAEVEWDLEESEDLDTKAQSTAHTQPESLAHPGAASKQEPAPKVSSPPAVTAPSLKLTSLDDLSIQPPQYPQVDFSKPWFSMQERDLTYAIYPSLPLVPTKQREISATTDLSLIPEHALLNLFPNQVMQTRGTELYQPVDGLEFFDDIGIILNIPNFTKKQVVDNIIKYPHLYNLKRNVEGKLIPFYKMIEVDGELFNTGDVWDTLPGTANLPKTTAFVKEYVVRRYLLERDILGVDHVSKIDGDILPFLTLFLPQEGYAKYSYSDAVYLAKSCVTARVRYKQARNPVLRRFANE